MSQALNIKNAGNWQLFPKTQDVFLEKKTYDIFGIQAETTITQEQLIFFFHYQDQKRLKKALDSCARFKRDFSLTLRFLYNKKDITWIRIAGLYAEAANGQEGFISGTVENITKEVKVDQDLKEILNEALTYEYSLNQVAIVSKTDSRGIIKSANDKFCKISKYHLTELVGQSHNIICSGSHSPEFWKNFWNTISAGNNWEGLIKNKAKDGTPYWVYTYIIPVLSTNNKIQEYMSLRYEKTQEIESNILLNAEREKRVHSSKMATLGEMAAGIAHEINNPLMIINGYFDILFREMQKSELDQERLKKYLEKSYHAVQRISKIIKGLKGFSRKSDSDPFQKVEVEEFLEETLAFCQNRMNKTNVNFSIENSVQDLSFLARSSEISQVLVNLLVNAVDAAENKDEPMVKLITYEDNNCVIFEVHDNGDGVNEKHAQKIFEPFFTTKDQGKGTGLGLSICHKIITGHKGSLSYTRKEGFTVFRFSLPLYQEAA